MTTASSSCTFFPITFYRLNAGIRSDPGGGRQDDAASAALPKKGVTVVAAVLLFFGALTILYTVAIAL
jgi:hypothetical protein